MKSNTYYVLRLTSSLIKTAKETLPLSGYFTTVYQVQISAKYSFLIFSNNTSLSIVDKLNIITKYLITNSVNIEVNFPELITYVETCNNYRLSEPLLKNSLNYNNKSKLCYSLDCKLINIQNNKHKFIAETIINLPYLFNDVIYYTDKYGNKLLILKK